MAAQYESGPLYLGAGYHKANDPQALNNFVGGALGLTAADVAGAYNDDLTAWRLAGTYKFGFGMKISGLWDNQKYEIDSNTLGSGDDPA